MFIYKEPFSLSLLLVLLNFVFLISHAIGQQKNDCNFVLKSRNGFLTFPTKERCHTYFYEIEAELNSSIIKITSVQNMNDNDAQDYFGRKAVSKLVDIENTIVVTFTEKTTLKDGRTFPIPLEEWKLTTQNLEKEHLYLSRTNHLSIRVTVIGNWTAKIVTFSYEELPFKVFNMYSNEETGSIFPNIFTRGMKNRGYSPHSACVFQIKKSPNMNVSSIIVDLNYLDIDEGIGEYLLIGAGKKPWDGSPPLFISNTGRKAKTYLINDQNAYVIFVASSTREHHTGFKLTWRHNGTKIKIEEDIPIGKDEAELQSIQVCIYNYTAAEIEFQKPAEDRFMEFRKELALIALKEVPNINASQVSFYRISAAIRGDKFYEEGFYYVMLKIEGVEKGRAPFKRPLLQKLFDNYNSSHEFNGYRIGNCPTRKTGNFGLYAIIPIFCCVFIFIWTWKQNPLSQYFTRNKLRKQAIKIRQSQDTNGLCVEDNIYSVCPPSFRLPKLHLTDELGRRFTLNYSDTMAAYAEDNDPKIEAESVWTRRRSSRIQELLNMRRSNRSSILRAEINEGYEDEENSNSITTATAPEEIINEHHETENLYDSLKSSKSLVRTKGTSTTKL